MIKRATTLLAFLTSAAAYAQTEETEIFTSWNTVSQQEDTASRKAVSHVAEKIRETETDFGFKTLYLQNTRLTIPVNYTEEGMDVFMLTEEGITIHMAALEPVFLQETTPDLIKWIRFYAYSRREHTRRIFSRYEKWEPYIRACFKTFGVPEDIAILCLVESGCSYDAVSSAGATGMWQIMAGTARDWGLTVDSARDDRLDPVLSSETAAKILADNYRDCGDWTLAVAGYNCGKGRVGKSIKQSGINQWTECRTYLPSETQQYIPALLAVHYVWKYRKELGFNESGQP